MTDIVTSTEMAAELGDNRWRELVRLHHALVRAALRRYDGREVDTAGDGFFAVFDAPASAIQCAVDIVAGVHELGIQVRAGVHVGEVEQIGGKVGGITVPIGARISALAEPDEVLVSATVRDLAAGADLHFEDRGVRTLKGVPGEWRLYAVTRIAADTPADAGTAQERASRRAAAVRRAQARPFWRRHPRLATALVAGLAAVIGGSALLIWSPWRPPALAGVAENTVGTIDPARNEIVGQIAVGNRPAGIAAGEGAVWVANSGDGSVSRIDQGTRAVNDTIDVGSTPSSVAVGNGSIWVANSGERNVSRINAATRRVVDTLAVGNGPTAIAFGAGAVWVANTGDGTVMRLDADTGQAGPPIGVGATPVALAADDGGVWVASLDGGVIVHLDPRSGVTLAAPIAVGPRPVAVAIGAGSVWVASAGDGSVSRVDPVSHRVIDVVDIGGTPTAIAADAQEVWVAGSDGVIRRFDARNLAVAPVRISAGSQPAAIARVGEQLWFTALASATSHRGGTLRVVSADGPGRETRGIGGEGILWSLVTDGLVGFRRVGGIAGSTLVPNLAASLPRPTDGGKTYTFQLRQGLTYSNGQPVRPEDFRNAIERGFQVEDPFVGGPLDPPYFTGIEGAAACADAPVPRCDLSAGIVTDATAGTITFHLVAADPDFLYKLAGKFPVPAGAAPANKAATQPVPGTGPYMITTFTDKEIHLARNPHFRSWDAQVRPDGYVDEIDWTMGITPAEGVPMVERGEADYYARRVPPEMIERLRTEHTPQLHVGSGSTTAVWMNTLLPPLDKLEVRQALNLAVDRARIVEMTGGPKAAATTCQVLPPNFPGYQPYCPWTKAPDAGGRWTAPDMEAAKRLVDISGTRGAKVVVGPMNQRFNATIGPYIVSVLNDLGYVASLRVAETGEEVFKAIYEKSVQVGVIGWLADYPAPSSFLAGFTCTQPDGLSNYCDPDLDAMVARALDLQVTDATAAAAQWAAVDRKVVDLAIWAPLVNEGAQFVSSRVGNYQFNPQWGILLDQLWVQ